MMNFPQNYKIGISEMTQDFVKRKIIEVQLPMQRNVTFSENKEEEQAALNTSSPNFVCRGLEKENTTFDMLCEASILQSTENKLEEANNFPTLDEHDNGGYKFEINLSTVLNRNYSSKLQKIFVKINQSLYIDVLYTPKLPHIPLFVRAMMVFIDDIAYPVHRCYKHILNSDSNSITTYYILHSENKNVTYKGNYHGKTMKDRLSLLIPLNENKPNENNIVKHLIVLKLNCQNSCFGRKRTAIMFTLEDKCSHILGKKVINIKVCSSPKRDRENDEVKFLSRKRENDQENYSFRKMIKVDSSDFTDENHQNNHFPEIKYEMNIPKHLEFEISHAIFNIISGKIILDSKNAEKYSKYIEEAKKRINN